jgi:hypothetical protein
VVPSPEPGTPIRGGDQGIHFRPYQKAYQCSREPLARDSEHTLDLRRVRRELEGRVAKERMDGSQAQVAAANTNRALALKMVQEGDDQRCIDLLELQIGRRGMQALLGELEKQSKRVSIGANRVRTGLALLHQALCEEPLEQCGETDRRAHDRTVQRRSNRAIASRINAGALSRYHCVSLTCTCPRESAPKWGLRSLTE